MDLRYNALHSDDSSLIAFLNSKQSGGDWQRTQTVAPTTLSVSTVFDSYLWNTGETSQAISVDPAQPRFYWVTVTSTGSCQESAIILADPAIFTDSFEGGDTSSWGS